MHASLLPKYRGAAPIQWAIARGETRTGVTTMRINEGLDTGDMLLKWETAIGPRGKRRRAGRSVWPRRERICWCARWPNSRRIRPEPQDDSQATYAPILKKEDGKIDWQLSAQEILNRIRGFEPWPGGYGFLRGQRLQIWSAAVGDRKLPPGALRVMHHKLYAGCGRGESIELREIQLEGKKTNAGGRVFEWISAERGRGAGVSLPQGFRYAAVYAGIRKVAKDDLALIVSDTPAVAAAVFTQNRVVAAPVVLARKNLAASRGKASAILVNAGNANCATRTGDQVALATVRATAKALGRQAGIRFCPHPPA